MGDLKPDSDEEMHTWIAAIYRGLADALESGPGGAWDAGSLCERWKTRHVVAHVSMPIRLTPEQYGEEIAAAGGDFTAMSDARAERDAALPEEDHLAALRAPQLHAWEPPGGGAAGALNHAVIHSLDVTLALAEPSVAPVEAQIAVLDQLTAANGSYFGIDLTDMALETTDADWRWGTGETLTANSAELVALLSGRTLPDGRSFPRV